MKTNKIIKVTFHVSTNRVGSENTENVEIEVPVNATDEEIEKIISEEYNDWLGNNTDQGWSIIEE